MARCATRSNVARVEGRHRGWPRQSEALLTRCVGRVTESLPRRSVAAPLLARGVRQRGIHAVKPPRSGLRDAPSLRKGLVASRTNSMDEIAQMWMGPRVGGANAARRLDHVRNRGVVVKPPSQSAILQVG